MSFLALVGTCFGALCCLVSLHDKRTRSYWCLTGASVIACILCSGTRLL